jgi:hypothetical protein
MTIGEHGPPVPIDSPAAYILIAINERIASELLARNRRITDKNIFGTFWISG